MKTPTWILTLLIAVIALGPLACGESPTSPGKIAGDPITTLTAVRNITNGSFYDPTQIQYSNGALWVANYSGENLMKMDPGGSLLKNITSFNGSGFYHPWGVSTDPTGRVFAADYGNYAVEVFNGLNGAYQTSVGQLSGTHPIGVVATSDALYVLPYNSYVGIFVFPIKGTSAPTFGNPTIIATGVFYNPFSLRSDGSGNLWVADYGNGRLVEIDRQGNPIKYVYNNVTSFNPSDIAFDQGNNMYVTDDYHNDIVIFTPNGKQVATITGGGLSEPEGITTDKHGTFYVTDYNHSRIVVYQ